jgi:hypothetical protein
MDYWKKQNQDFYWYKLKEEARKRKAIQLDHKFYLIKKYKEWVSIYPCLYNDIKNDEECQRLSKCEDWATLYHRMCAFVDKKRIAFFVD